MTDEGEVISREPNRQTQSEKAWLRAAIARLREGHASEEARSLARLAASYLLAGDVETARRYLDRAAGSETPSSSTKGLVLRDAVRPNCPPLIASSVR